MDMPTLHSILLHTFSTDAEARKAAEEAIGSLHTVRGSIVLLVQLLSSDDVQREIRQAGAISLKNIVQKHWGPMEEHDEQHEVPVSAFPDPDKEEYRAFILEGLFASHDNSIQALLVECVSLIARQDFPEKWPHLVEQICTTIQSGQPHRIINALLALRKLVKIYEYKPSHQRETLNTIVAMTFPLLRTMLQQLVTNPSLEAGHMVHLITKVFWSSMQCSLPPFLTLEEIGAWLELYKLLLTKPVVDTPAVEPHDVMDEDEIDDLAMRNPWWKAKKWTLQIICRFYNVYANPKHGTSTPELSAFFRNHVAPHLLVAVLETLSLRPQHQICPDRIVQLCLLYLQEAILSASAYKQLQPHLDFVLFKVIHPLLTLTRRDLELLASDPHEYIRRSSDVLGEYLNPVCAAEALLLDLCTKRGKDCVVQVLAFYQTLLLPAPETDAQWLDKEAALHALCALDSFLTISPAHQSQMESIVLAHVLPSFQNPRPFIRLRAVKMLSRNYMTKLVFADTTMVAIVSHLLQCLQDVDLVVRIEAAKSFRHIVLYAPSTIVLDTLRPQLPSVLDQFFKILDDVGVGDEVVLALEQLIDSFCDEMAPYAVQLVVRLTQRFRQCLDKEADDEDGAGDEASFTAASCLDTINTILMSIYNQPTLFEPLIETLVPTLHQLLVSDAYLDFIESALDIVKSIAFYSGGGSGNPGSAIHPKVWALFPTLFRGADVWGSEYMHPLVVVLYALIGRDANGFLAAVFQVKLPDGTLKRVRYIELVYNMVRKLLHRDVIEDSDDVWGACAILDCVLQNCDGVDVFVPPALQLVCFRLSRTPTTQTQEMTYLLSVILSALRYNARLTLSVLDKMKIVDPIVQSLVRSADMRSTYADQKIYVLGIMALLALPLEDLEAHVQAPIINALLVKVVQKIHEIIVRSHQAREASQQQHTGAAAPQSEKTLEALIHQGGYASDEDADTTLPEDYDPSLFDLQHKHGAYEDDDDKEYYSRIDSLDEIAVFLDTVHAIKETQPRTWQALGLGTNQEFHQTCEVFAGELRRRQEQAQRAEQQHSHDGKE
ncbi:hypothetical protein LEN26_003799 [Aphanomyces euteiches]|nr:hypothetical protein AeMF1_010388 [Aphanomyces euteiches]KAH9151813.1 hypothetical protein LEN26_003799 [Aphanomyces euteiches]KAH9186847.1 hypothetical protein AeNC1_011174 [Aphanomyces euteiches]